MRHSRHALPTRAPQSRGRRLLRGLLCLFFGMATAAQGTDEVPMRRSAVPTAPQAEAAWRQLEPLLHAIRGAQPLAQLQRVNLFFNSRIEFSTDQQAWGWTDYWASPLEALDKGRGDCEDYAIAKYFSLLTAGMPAARLRLVYVRSVLDDGPPQAHMVLAYYPPTGHDTLILDNLVDEIVPAVQRSDLTPVFSFNSEGLWQGVGQVRAGDPRVRLSRWREVMVKARAEGFF